MKVSVTACAKINLWLEVLRKRPDGYHDLSTLMLPVGIQDRLDIETCSEGLELRCDHPEVPTDARNLLYRAAEAFFERSGWRIGLRLYLVKGIAVGAGLGGGSADAAALLRFLNTVAPEPLPSSTLHELARGLGGDVPFFLLGRPALATGIGDQLQPIVGLPQYPLLLMKPPYAVSTAWAYGSLKLTRGGSRIKIQTLLACPLNPASCLENDLEDVVAKAYSDVVAIKEWLLHNGAVGALMTGSGPTVFGIFETVDQARAVATRIPAAWSRYWWAVTTTLNGPQSCRAR
ncbi:4-(cytidine 5'-diphospho)-2-C-methyl-D-erythritol kinase [Desulfosoma caldarium]|uniref:4-diphosphocytidyl-2-C-methyl-D-erythritol kinase n=1 Tax=Desulfosoma caldarium TaxID=610254 RepID=A0A3N1UQZ2_9BACT|nr:4-(cytidine 5'-diphospho)-2-C-methyl-D-erythritol kinase [Desulfosoma caldarium]ROQ90967.1 4-diphosphocytidyl-2-C-methyl-D-erythritol kinase [Desulfosoma caldarium]